jgi:ferredoxin
MLFLTMAHKKQGYRFENDWTLERLKSSYVKAAVTVPVNVKIEAEHLVLNLDNITKILSNARTISVLDCVCRAEFGNCDAPVNVCVDMNETAERNIANGSAREITFDEALDIIKKTHEAGLVPLALSQGEFYEPGVINSICSCCSCCCKLLSGILRFGLAPHVLTSQAISVTDTSDCTECGACVDRCQFGAREMVNGSLAFNPNLCFGCGLCISTCPTNAITLV